MYSLIETVQAAIGYCSDRDMDDFSKRKKTIVHIVAYILRVTVKRRPNALICTVV